MERKIAPLFSIHDAAGLQTPVEFLLELGGEGSGLAPGKPAVLLGRDGEDLHSRGPQAQSVEQNGHGCGDGYPPDDPVAQDEAP